MKKKVCDNLDLTQSKYTLDTFINAFFQGEPVYSTILIAN